MNKYILNDRYAWRKLENNVLILDTHSGDYFVLNESGSEIWTGLMSDNRTEEIVTMMCDNFIVSQEDAFSDVKDFVESLHKDGILQHRE